MQLFSALFRIPHMPELAEVFYYSKQWDEGQNQTIQSVALHENARVFRGCDLSALKSGLEGQKLRGHRTHGKQIFFEFSSGHCLGVHLGMTGEIKSMPQPYEPQKHDHLVLHTQKLVLVFTDPRMFGLIEYLTDKGLKETLAGLPPQSMEAAFTIELLQSILHRHAKSPLKALLLDQRYFPGVGNWMADEAMWQMRLLPTTPAGELNAVQTKLLRTTLKKICEVALKTIGVDWTDPPESWLFLHRWDKAKSCPRCGVGLIKEELRGRTACWCPNCQH